MPMPRWAKGLAFCRRLSGDGIRRLGRAVAVGWSEYLHNLLLITTGYELPRALLHAPLVKPRAIRWKLGVKSYQPAGGNSGRHVLCAAGARLAESARANAIMVIIKLAVLALFIAIA